MSFSKQLLQSFPKDEELFEKALYAPIRRIRDFPTNNQENPYCNVHFPVLPLSQT